MTTTPEQLQAWREEFEKPLIKEDLIRDSEYPADYQDREIESNWIGYLRRCQETEQIMKLAKFGADCMANAPLQVIARVAESHGLMFEGEFEWEVEPNIEATIKELLND